MDGVFCGRNAKVTRVVEQRRRAGASGKISSGAYNDNQARKKRSIVFAILLMKELFYARAPAPHNTPPLPDEREFNVERCDDWGSVVEG